MQRIRLVLFLVVLSLGTILAACGGLAGNGPVTALPSATPRTEQVVATSQVAGSGLATRPPSTKQSEAPAVPATTKRPVTPTRPASVNGFRTIGIDQLPPEAREILALIERGGPFPYRQDGQVFQNRERLLPNKPRGYYHEYTVDTPGSDDRGARRIITGENGELYYTDDHYNSFKVIVNNE